MNKGLFTTLLVLLISGIVSAQQVLCADDFSNFEETWVIEKVDPETQITYSNESLDIIAPGGITLWYKQQFSGNLQISFDALVVNDGGKWDRVSDLNCFWMASDPEYPDDFFARSDWRNGVFGNYYSLKMYYVGYGGNNNSTTRFRKYKGNFKAFKENKIRPKILQEYTHAPHLIVPNQWVTVKIVVNEGQVQYFMNDELLFDFTDPSSYQKGYFGLRTVRNHIRYRNFKVIQLKNE